MAAFANKIGVISDSFGLGVYQDLLEARKLGAEGVQIWATQGEMDPVRMTTDRRKELRQYAAGLGLDISALCADYGGWGFRHAADNPHRIEQSKRVMELALDLDCRIVTTHIGIIPKDTNHDEYKVLQEACNELGRAASALGGYFAIETGPEPADRLKQFLDSLNTPGVAVNFDPANMVMVTGDDPVQGVYSLRDYIVHTHVKDGIRLREVDPYEVYGELSHDQIATMAETGAGFREVPLGEGTVDFAAYFAALQAIGYTGYLTIEREAGQQPHIELEAAIRFVRRYLGA